MVLLLRLSTTEAGNTPWKTHHCSIEGLSLERFSSCHCRVERSDSGAIRELEERAPSGAALVVRERVFRLVVIELLISVEQMVPARDAILARLGRVDDLGVVLKTRAVAGMLVVAVVT